MTIINTISHYRDLINRNLELFLKNKIQRAEGISPHAKEIMENILEFNLRGGKRIRPMLVIFGYKAAGGKGEKEILKAALAVELMEAFLLIHDDIIDQDTLRRGKETMHVKYERIFEKRRIKGDKKKYGESMAILAGDILSVLGNEAILDTGFPVKNKMRAAARFNSAVINTCFGQVLDIESNHASNIAESDIRNVHELKTAIYSIEAPLQIGAYLAGSSQKVLDALSRYALPLGRAFQIQDDILGIFGTQKKLGKPIGSDIREGKKTLLILKALELAEKKDADFIKKKLGAKSLAKKDICRIKDIITKTGSLEYSKEKARNLVWKAKKAISGNILKKEGKDFLLGLADYLLEREN